MDLMESIDAHRPGEGPAGTRGLSPRWVVLGVLSVAGALGIAIASAAGRQIDFDIYRMGGAHVLGQHLYQIHLPHTDLPFTYPPFAALLFWPFTQLPVRVGQILWSVSTLAGLAALTAVSIRALRREWSVRRLWSIAFVLMLPILLLRPDLSTLNYGQVNIFIALMVLADLTGVVGLRSHELPRGVLLGIACSIKLTPLIFIPLLFLTRQFRAGLTALGTFVLCSLGALAVAPHSSWLYWSREVFDSKRSGNLLYVSDQNLSSALHRMAHATPSPALLDPLSLLVATCGLALAACAYRRSSPMLGILLCAATGLIVSPVSWYHHYVWIVPLLAWLLLGSDRPRGATWWALGSAALFWAAPMWWVPDPQRGFGGPLVLLEGNSFFLATVAFLLLAVLLLWSRGRSGRSVAESGRSVAESGAKSGAEELASSDPPWQPALWTGETKEAPG